MTSTNGTAVPVWKLLPGLKPGRSLLSPEVCRGDAGALWARMMISDDMRLPKASKVVRVTELPNDDDEAKPVHETEENQTDTSETPFPMPERFSDVGNALRLKAKYGDEIAYVPGVGWIAWDSHRWQQREADNYVNLRCQDIAKSFYLDATLAKSNSDRQIILRHWLKSENGGNLRSVMGVAQTHLMISPDLLDQDPMVFNCANGTVDLRTGALRLHNRKDWITKVSPVNYREGAKAPRWERFLQEIFKKHLDVIPYLQRLIGFAMTGSTSDRAFTIFYGPTANNGKDTLLRHIRFVFGDYGTEANASTLMRRHPNSAESPAPALLALAGCRFVYVSEVEHDGQLSESLIKSMTGNAPIVGRGMYERKPTTLVPTFKVFLATNDLPKVHWDAAFASRVKPIPFDECFLGREDRKLDETLASEYEGILTWMVDGARRWYADGLGPRPGSIEVLLHEYESQTDVLADFIYNKLTVGDSRTVVQRKAFEAWQMWASDNRIAPGTQRQFTQALQKKIPTLKLSAINSGRVGTYKGIALKGTKPPKPEGMPQDVWDSMYEDD